MQLLRDKAQQVFTGFYLGPAPSHGDDGWMDRRDFLIGLGFASHSLLPAASNSPSRLTDSYC